MMVLGFFSNLPPLLGGRPLFLDGTVEALLESSIFLVLSLFFRSVLLVVVVVAVAVVVVVADVLAGESSRSCSFSF